MYFKSKIDYAGFTKGKVYKGWISGDNFDFYNDNRQIKNIDRYNYTHCFSSIDFIIPKFYYKLTNVFV